MQLNNQKFYKSVKFKDKILIELCIKKQLIFQIFKGKRYDIRKRATVFYIQIMQGYLMFQGSH